MIFSQPGLTRPFVNLLTSKDIDWDGNCIFDGGRVTGFKVDKTTNHRHMKPIPTDEGFKAAARASQVTLEELLRPATPEQIILEIKKLSLHCGKTIKAEEEAKFIFMDYCKDLSKYPIRLIAEACDNYRKLPKGNSFMPKSGRLIELLTIKYHKIKFWQAHNNKILELHVEPEVSRNQVPTLDEILKDLL